MDYISYEQLADFFEGAAKIFCEKQSELCDMDAKMGDGDLGLTMQKGFGELPGLIRENGESGNIGKTLRKAGMKMAGIVPSTMGTLMASGIIEAGKAIGETDKIGRKELVDFFMGFTDGIKKRGKCQLGDRTVLDAVAAGAEYAERAFLNKDNIADIMQAAVSGADKGVEKTKDMLPKYGKAAVFAAKAKGVPDQGAMAGKYLFEGLARFFE